MPRHIALKNFPYYSSEHVLNHAVEGQPVDVSEADVESWQAAELIGDAVDEPVLDTSDEDADAAKQAEAEAAAKALADEEAAKIDAEDLAKAEAAAKKSGKK
jgi:hypothetical protein